MKQAMKKHKKKIAIISRESNDKTLDISMLEAELLKRGCDVTVLSRLLTKEKSIKALGYIGHVIRQEAAILASDVVVLDTYCIPASMIPHRKGTKVIQMWHALGAIKKFGWQTVGKEGGSSEKVAKLMMMHRGYDYVISPSDITADYFCEAFDTDKSRVVKYGLPRIDYIKSVAAGERHDDTARRILTKYPQLRRQDRQENRPPVNFKKVILYAPTFRPGKAVDVQSLIDSLDPEKYELVVKLHPVYKGAVQGRQTVENGSGSTLNVIYDESFSSYDWLSVADIIVSDYSSFVIEAALADKPLFIYAYDLKEYDTSTGLNMDFYSEPIAPYVFEDACALSQGIDKKYDMDLLCAFRDRYIDIDTGSNADDNHCTAKLADFIESLM